MTVEGRDGQTSAGLRWTGHAMPDVAIATACAFVKRSRPEDLTWSDLDEIAKWLEESYRNPVMAPYLGVAFTNNGPFTNPNQKGESRLQKIEKMLRAHRSMDIDEAIRGERCVFTGLEAHRALNRQHLPLFTGEKISHCRPNGQQALPVYGPLAVVLNALPMGARRAEGAMMLVHAEKESLTLRFARRFLEDNRRLLALTYPTTKCAPHEVPEGFERELPVWDSEKGKNKYGDVKAPRSFVVSELAKIEAEIGEESFEPSSVTVHLVNNGGQSAGYERVAMPGELVAFIGKAQSRATKLAWDAIARRFDAYTGDRQEAEDRGASAEEDATDETSVAPSKRGKKGRAKNRSSAVGRPGWTRNVAFEELCEVFSAGFVDRHAAQRWLRRHVLQRIEARGEDARDKGKVDEAVSKADRETSKALWALAALFAQEVLTMKKARIEAIKRFADRCAEAIAEDNDRALYRAIVWQDNAWEVRAALLKWARRSAERGKRAFGFDEFTHAWLGDDDVETGQRLVHDLLTLRVLEQLQERGWFDDGTRDEGDSKSDQEEARAAS
jgi:hypothetical protein